MNILEETRLVDRWVVTSKLNLALKGRELDNLFISVFNQNIKASGSRTWDTWRDELRKQWHHETEHTPSEVALGRRD